MCACDSLCMRKRMCACVHITQKVSSRHLQSLYSPTRHTVVPDEMSFLAYSKGCPREDRSALRTLVSTTNLERYYHKSF